MTLITSHHTQEWKWNRQRSLSIQWEASALAELGPDIIIEEEIIKDMEGNKDDPNACRDASNPVHAEQIGWGGVGMLGHHTPGHINALFGMPVARLPQHQQAKYGYQDDECRKGVVYLISTSS